MRLKLISPVLAVALVGTGIALMTATSSQAAPVKLYFHSAAGGYLADWQADTGSFDADNAPKGSTMDAKAPTKTADSEAQSTSPYRWSGLPTQPSFSLPFSGDVTSMCLDLWLAGTDSPVTGVTVSPNFYTSDGTILAMESATTATGSGILRVTAMVKPDGVAKHPVPKDTEFIVAGYLVDDPDFTLVYDSVSHPSSITINATECKGAPVVVPSATATPAPSGSASATPAPSGSATATPAPSGSASATPAPSGSATATATPSATPSPTPPPPPPPAQETSLDYTGPSGARYTDTAIVSARMSLPDGSPVPAGAVEFTLGTVVVRYNVNSNGVASGRLPVKVAPGQHVLTARYLANSAYLGAAEQASFTVSRMPTRCAITRTRSGSNLVLTGALRDAAGRVLGGHALQFRYNNRTFRTLRTDRNGRATTTVAARGGTYTVALPTGSYYTGCSASFRI